VLARSRNPGTQASAWFNKGLACEENQQKYLVYNGTYYCGEPSLHTFLRAWKLGPSRARSSKVREVFQDAPSRTCAIGKEGGGAQLYRFEFLGRAEGSKGGQVQRIYVLHPIGQTIDASRVSWTIRFYNAPKPTTIVPRLVGRYELGDVAITELNADYQVQGMVTIGDQTCSPFK
jgi:hypothetical protein